MKHHASHSGDNLILDHEIAAYFIDAHRSPGSTQIA